MKQLENLRSLTLVIEALRSTPRSKSTLIKMLREKELIPGKTGNSAAEKRVQRLISELKDEGAEIKSERINSKHHYRLVNRDFSVVENSKELVDDDEVIAPMIAARFASMILPEPMKAWVETNINKTIDKKSAIVLDTALVETILVATGTKVTIDENIFKDIFESWLHRKVVTFSYPKGDKIETRSVEPYLLVYHNQAWYLKGIDCHKDQTRVFAIHRISDLEVTSSEFPVDNDLLKIMLKEPIFNYKMCKVKVLCSKDIAGYAKEQAKARGQELTVHEDGSVTFTISNTPQHEIISWILSEGGKAKVIEPEELREKVREAADAIKACH